jgi:hypothetical protein
MMTTGGGASGLGETAAGEDFAEDARGRCALADVGPATSSDPLDGDAIGGSEAAEDTMAADRERYTVVYCVVVTTLREGEAEPVTPGAAIGLALLAGELVELVTN